MRVLFHTLCFGLMANPIAAQTRTTIPEEAARVSPGPLTKTRIAETRQLDVPEMVRAAEVIVLCTLEKSRVYLSPDETELYTEFRATPTQIVLNRKPHTFATPGQHQLLVRQWGGQTVINGVLVNVIDFNVSPLPVGVPLVLLLEQVQESSAYQVVWGGAGAFSARNGRVHVMYLPPKGADQFNGLAVDQFLDQLRGLSAGKRRE